MCDFPNALCFKSNQTENETWVEFWSSCSNFQNLSGELDPAFYTLVVFQWN